MTLLYEHNTVAKLAKVLKDRHFSSSARDAADRIDPAVEVALDDSIAAKNRPTRQAPYKTIFLTGATGFLGAFLLRDLFKSHPDAKVCGARRCE